MTSDEDNEEELEAKISSRRFGNVADPEYTLQADRLKHLLPVKTGKGQLVSRFVELTEEEVRRPQEDAEEETNRGGPARSPREDLLDRLGREDGAVSAARLYAERAALLTEYKAKIASISGQLLQNPEEKVHKLKDLLSMGRGETEPLVAETVQKLAIASLYTVLLSIIPGYKIRERTEAEKEHQLKKETKQLVEFEEALLRNYRKYLQILESLVPDAKKHGKRRKTTG